MGLLIHRSAAVARSAAGRTAALAGAVALITAAVFWPVLQNGFVAWDDRSNFLANTAYRGLGPAQLRWMWTTFHRGHYAPLSWMTLGADYLLYGLHPRGYHFTNLALHALNAAGVFVVARLIFARAEPGFSRFRVLAAAAVSALFFSLHPLRVESVAWITERRDVLGAFFLLVSAACYLKRFEDGGLGGRRWAIGAFLFFALSLGAKSLGMVFPAVLLLLDHFPLDRWRVPANRRALVVEKIPYVLLAVTMAAVAARAQVAAEAALSLDRYPLAHRLAQMGYGGLFYVEKTLWPFPLAALYPFPSEGPASAAVLVRCAGTVALTVAALFFLFRRPGPAVGWLVYLAFFLPTSGIFQSGGQFVADRYSYLACLPAALGFGRWASAGTERSPWRRWIAGTAAALLSIAAVLTHRQTAHWKDAVSLWKQVAAVSPGSASAALTVAQLALEAGDLAEAGAAAERALRFNPNDPVVLHLAGHIDLLRGAPDAIPRLEAARRGDPTLPGLSDSLGAAYFQGGRFADAERMFRETAEKTPGSAGAWYNVGLTLVRQERWRPAREMFDRVLEIDPQHDGARTRRADCFRREKTRGRGPAGVLLKNP